MDSRFMKFLVTLAASISLLMVLKCQTTSAFAQFRSRIPNGFNVPNPCMEGAIWNGVGHLSRFGGGANNQFGLDFKAAGYQWTQDLCLQDSDGDGKTNGEELGDSTCVWTAGATPSSTNVTHPGVIIIVSG